MELAPIVLFCYNRPIHLKKTVKSLLLNDLAKDSRLIVFSDGAKTLADEAAVKSVRNYLEVLSGFSSVETHYSAKNKGLAPSIIHGVSTVLKQYGKAIIMEDDLECSSDFLLFMNNALEKYKHTANIFSVTGFNYGASFTEEVTLIKRASSLGWGTWLDRWEKVDWEVKDYDQFMQSKESQELLRMAGEDILPMFIKQQRGLISSWAVRWTYHHCMHNGFCLVPRLPKIRTTGIDGSGTHSVATNMRKLQPIYNVTIELPEIPQTNNQVMHFIRFNNRPSLIRRIINWWKFKVW